MGIVGWSFYEYTKLIWSIVFLSRDHYTLFARSTRLTGDLIYRITIKLIVSSHPTMTPFLISWLIWKQSISSLRFTWHHRMLLETCTSDSMIMFSVTTTILVPCRLDLHTIHSYAFTVLDRTCYRVKVITLGPQQWLVPSCTTNAFGGPLHPL